MLPKVINGFLALNRAAINTGIVLLTGIDPCAPFSLMAQGRFPKLNLEIIRLLAENLVAYVKGKGLIIQLRPQPIKIQLQQYMDYMEKTPRNFFP